MLPGTRQLTDDLWRLRITSECGLVVNAYLLRSDGAICLIDTGFSHTVDQLEASLDGLGLGVADVTDVLYTHTHVDHIGGGVALSPRWSPREWLWEGTEPAFDDVYGYLERIRTGAEWPLGFLPCPSDTDPLVLEMHAKPRAPIRTTGDGQLGRPLGVGFGERVAIGAYEFECVDGRGHDPYHCGWFCAETGWLFSGDVLMAVPTPLVAGMGDDVGVWMETLNRWERGLSVGWLLPGHGMPTKLFGPSIARSRSALVRLYGELCRQLDTGLPVDPLVVTRGILPTDRSRFGARSAVLLANVETLLSTLATRGDVVCADDGRWRRSGVLPTLEELR